MRSCIHHLVIFQMWRPERVWAHSFSFIRNTPGEKLHPCFGHLPDGNTLSCRRGTLGEKLHWSIGHIEGSFFPFSQHFFPSQNAQHLQKKGSKSLFLFSYPPTLYHYHFHRQESSAQYALWLGWSSIPTHKSLLQFSLALLVSKHLSLCKLMYVIGRFSRPSCQGRGLLCIAHRTVWKYLVLQRTWVVHRKTRMSSGQDLLSRQALALRVQRCQGLLTIEPENKSNVTLSN